MPNPTEIATLVVGGERFELWETVEVERLWGAPISHFRFTASEPGPTLKGWQALKLMPSVTAQVYLAGKLALTGLIQIRQAAYDANSHSVEIIVASYTQELPASSVDAARGQYLKNSLEQIANAVCSKVGVAVKFQSGIPGADKIFSRVSEHVGETRLAFLQRLAQMRNMHLCDDSSGALVFGRGAADGPGAVLVEGHNILKGRILLDQQWTVKSITALLQNHGTDDDWPTNDISATVPNPAYTGTSPRPLKLLGPHPGDQVDALMVAQYEKSLNDLTTCEALITVQGWLMDDGSLWSEHLREKITIKSPMLVPVDTFSLLLRGVKHMQSDANGTTTELNLCIPNGLGDDRQITSVLGLV